MAVNFLLDQPTNEQWAVMGATDASGVRSLQTTTAAANDALLMQQPNGQWCKIATVKTAGVHVLRVTNA